MIRVRVWLHVVGRAQKKARTLRTCGAMSTEYEFVYLKSQFDDLTYSSPADHISHPFTCTSLPQVKIPALTLTHLAGRMWPPIPIVIMGGPKVRGLIGILSVSHHIRLMQPWGRVHLWKMQL